MSCRIWRRWLWRDLTRQRYRIRLMKLRLRNRIKMGYELYK